MKKRVLYLGLDPQGRDVVHYPVIRTVPIRELDERTKAILPEVTHFIFTSRRAFQHWCELAPIHGTVLTLSQAPFATQEGMIELLKTIPKGFFFWPRSKLARPLLEEYLQTRKYYVLDLYDTVPQKLEPVPDLNEFDEVVFTSPSTVDAFLAIYGTLPKNGVAIGPITLQKMLSVR